MGVKEEETGNVVANGPPPPNTRFWYLNASVKADSWFEARAMLAVKLGMSPMAIVPKTGEK